MADAVPPEAFQAYRQVLEGRVQRQPIPSRRLEIHEESIGAAQRLSRPQLADYLEERAMGCSTRSSERPLVTLTPEMVLAIAHHLKHPET